MSDTEKTLRDGEALNVIKTLSSNHESGRLLLRAGATAGAFFFRNGLLVDARVGNLTGFQAINAAASLPDVSFSFDSSVVPPAFSSITPSERVVLKQFFGIDTVGPEEFHDDEQLVYEDVDEVSDVDEVTLVGANAPRAEVAAAEVLAAEITPTEVPLAEVRPAAEVPRAEVPSAFPYPAFSNAPSRSGLGVAAVVFLLAIAAVALLYIFGEYKSPASVASTVETTEPSSPPAAEPVQPQVTPIDHTASVTPVEHAAPAARVDDSVPAAPIDHGTSAAPELTGNWNIVNTVQKTSYNSFNNLKVGFALSIQQNGDGFTGTGQKVSENGRSLPASSRTPIQVKGSIHGDRVEATFFEDGAARKTNGRFVWRVDKAGALTGTFTTNAARSSGKSTARKF